LGGRTAVTYLKKLLCFSALLIYLVFPPILARPAVYSVIAASPSHEGVAGQISPGNGAPVHYSQVEINQMLARTVNTYDLRKLIQCESQNTNIARMDSNGKISFGLLQFNGTDTWSQFAPLAGVSGTAMNPTAAIQVADWMISHGFLDRWTCARIQKLLK
jgi:hypothetical protein